MICLATYQPRPYQTECCAALAQARANGIKKGLVEMASGLGKTLTANFDVQQFLQDSPNARVLYLCHQESILLQSKQKFQKTFGEEYSYGMFTGNYKTSHAVTFLFATLQSMRDHREEYGVDAFDYVIVDEAHHTAAETYQPTADYFKPQFLLGLTATKDRMDGQDILDTYGKIIYRMDIYDGWEQGWLARVDYRIMLDDLKQEEFEKYVGPHATDEKVSLAQLNKTIFAPQRDEDIVKSIREQTSDLEEPRIFIFCPSVEHANAMAHQFVGEAAVIHSGQSIGLNEAILSNFRSGDIHIIISVNMLNEGIDVPEADVVVFLRATESSTIFFQQLGRGLRISGEKRTVRVLDYVANLERISTILEMEETAKKRITASPTYSPSANKPSPLVINIPATKFKVERVDIECLLSNIKKRRRWTKEEVVAGLIAMYESGQKITSKTIDQNPNLPWSDTIINMFGGSLNNAFREAGIPPNQRDKVNIDRDTMISEGRNMVANGEKITYRTVRKNLRLPHPATVAREFGPITEYASICGQVMVTKDLSRNGMLRAYWAESKKAEHWLSLNEVDKNKILTYAEKYRQKFGGAQELISLAKNTYGPILSPEETLAQQAKKFQETQFRLAQEFYEASQAKGRWLTQHEFKSQNKVSSLSRYRRYFNGGIKKIIEFTRQYIGDLDEEICSQQQTQFKTDAQLIKEYWLKSKEAGHWLSGYEVGHNSDLANDVTYYNRFGGMKNTRNLAISLFGDFTETN